MKMIHLTFVLLITLISRVFAQTEENWDAYIAQYDDGPGSVTLNMARKETAPVSALPFVVITGLKTKNCPADGFPAEKEMGKLQDAGDVIVAAVTSVTKAEFVGTFLYQCERLNYIYVSDTSRIRAKLISLYKAKYRDYSYHISIEADPAWETYLSLYPNEEVMEYMSNEKVIDQLQEAGDKLDKPRNIDYTFYFVDEKGREAFVKSIAAEGFKVTDRRYVKEERKMPYQLVLSRVGLVEVSSISEAALVLKKKAQEFKGDYDGWNTVVVK